MAHDHSYPESLNTLLTRLPELEIVLGPQAKPGLQAVQHLLQEAVAARADGDVPRAGVKIGAAKIICGLSPGRSESTMLAG